MNVYKLTTKALEKMDVLLLQSMVQLVQRQLKTTWTIDESADILLVDVEQPEGRTFWEAAPSDKLIVAYAKQNVYEAKWYLQKPIRVQPLVQLLNDLGSFCDTHPGATCPPIQPVLRAKETGQTSRTVPKPPVASEKTSTAIHFQPSQYLIGLIHTAVSTGQVIRFSYAESPAIYLLPQEQRCFTTTIPMTHLEMSQHTLFSVSANQIKQERLTATELCDQIEKLALRNYPVETILWKTALVASQGRLIYKHSKETIVKLKQWPNFASLPHLPAHINLAAFMLKKTADLATIAFKTQTPLPVVIDFFNACKVIDLVTETGGGESPLEKDITESKRDLFRSILRRLGK